LKSGDYFMRIYGDGGHILPAYNIS
jgi:hypothetical protein